MSSSSRIAVVPIVAGIGNALLAVPMVRQLKSRGGFSHVTVMARLDAMGEPFRRLPEVDHVIVTGNGTKNLLKGLLRVRTQQAEVFLIPFPSNRWQYAMMALFSGAKMRVMHAFPVGRLSAMHFVPATRVPAVRGIHDVEQNLRLLRAVGIEPDLNERPTFIVREQEREGAARTLRDNNISRDEFFVIHAGSARTILAQAKRWPAANYARLLALLKRESGLEPVLLEGPDEAGVAEEILRFHTGESSRPTVLRMTGNLGEAAAVLERAALYVGSDSGLAHLAAAVGTRAVTLFAPADPDRVCPSGCRDLVVKPDKPCSPCLQYPWHATRPKILCREPMCITEITVEQVLAVCSLSLREKAPVRARG
ncbi:MAG: glycosyltransferase family 9 protein [Tepidisphaeraceae bacterium]